MKLKKFASLLQYAKRLGVEYLVGTPQSGVGVQTFSVTGGGTTTDVVTFADNYVNGQQIKDMANTSYQVFLGYSATPAGKYCGSKTTTGFTITGLGSETVDIAVIGTIDGMPDLS